MFVQFFENEFHMYLFPIYHYCKRGLKYEKNHKHDSNRFFISGNTCNIK